MTRTKRIKIPMVSRALADALVQEREEAFKARDNAIQRVRQFEDMMYQAAKRALLELLETFEDDLCDEIIKFNGKNSIRNAIKETRMWLQKT